MFAPVLVTPPTALPVTLAELRLALRVDGSDFDAELTSLIKSAVAHYDGWKGILGIGLVEQTWRQDYQQFEQDMWLGLRPVRSITSVKWRNEAGSETTVTASDYALKTDGGGRSRVRFINDFSAPSGLYESDPVSVEYVIGWPVVDDVATTPEDIKAAIKLRVGMLYDHSTQEASDVLERIERELISKYRLPLF
jgi:uncharacterized phiE125 gp8 family phage protein